MGSGGTSEGGKDVVEDQLEWINLEEFLAEGHHESFREKIIRKSKESPLVPIGALATVAALGFGLRSMKTGNRRTSQLMMRTRVVAQGFTIAAITIGLLLSALKKKSTTAAPVVSVENDQ